MSEMPRAAARMSQLIVVAGLVATLQARVGSDENAPGVATQWGKAVHGIQAGIRMEAAHDAVRIGVLEKLVLVLRNASDHDISLVFPNAQRMYGWRVKEESPGRWVIAPKWRYADEEKVEKVVAGDMELTISRGKVMELPMDSPTIRIADVSGRKGRGLVIAARPGTRIRLRALPLTAAARGEEWLEKLVTGELTLRVEPR